MLLGTLLALLACGSPPDERAAPWTPEEVRVLEGLRLRSALPPDPSNRWADDAAAAALGRALFYDPGLSPAGFSCATCHDPTRHFTDGRRRGSAAGTTARHVPGIEGSQTGPWFFWDGRADSLWAQAAGPIESPDEMASDRVHVARHVVSRHREAWIAIFGEPPDLSDPLRFPSGARPHGAGAPAWAAMAEADRASVMETFVRALKALAAFERTLIPGEAPFDRYVDAVKAGDPDGGGHLDVAAVRGLRLFVGSAGCVSCHHGPLLTDHAFHNLGLPGQDPLDAGRGRGAAEVLAHELSCASPWSDSGDCPELRFLEPRFEDFLHAWKTPSLRNVAETAPYMHDGGMATLDDVLSFYSDLPGEPVRGHRELTLRPLGLADGQRADLAAFLGALTGPVRTGGLPP